MSKPSDTPKAGATSSDTDAQVPQESEAAGNGGDDAAVSPDTEPGGETGLHTPPDLADGDDTGGSDKADEDGADEGEAEPTGWGKGTIAALKAKLGGTHGDVVAEEITRLVEENTDMKDRMLRLAADMENLRKRTDREKADTARFAVSRFAEDMLRVGDSLGRALESVPDDLEDKDAALKSLRDGVEMTSTELLNGLQKHGVVKDEPRGEVFDPNRHQAIAEIEDTETPAGAIVEVFQAGYMISERVLRPAMVVISKGPAKVVPVETDAGDAAANDEAPVEETGAADAAANDDAPVEEELATPDETETSGS